MNSAHGMGMVHGAMAMNVCGTHGFLHAYIATK